MHGIYLFILIFFYCIISYCNWCKFTWSGCRRNTYYKYVWFTENLLSRMKKKNFFSLQFYNAIAVCTRDLVPLRDCIWTFIIFFNIVIITPSELCDRIVCIVITKYKKLYVTIWSIPIDHIVTYNFLSHSYHTLRFKWFFFS